MHEHRNAEPRRNLEHGTGLWSIDQEIAARAVDEEAAQPEIADRTLGFAPGPIAVIGIDRSQTVQPSLVTDGELRDVIVDLHDRIVRYAAIGIRDQICR